MDDGTNIVSAEYGYGNTTSYSDPFPLVKITVKSNMTKNIEETDWITFPYSI
ncbi:MAG: hypothetical protein GYA61_08340 [Spirochaetales bacterium]|nr:hypothetical protein [Spirochaetales bacterium]